MKPLIPALICFCIGVAATVVYLKESKTMPMSVSDAESFPAQTTAQMESRSVAPSELEPPRIISKSTAPIANSVSNLKSEAISTALSQAVDTLISSQANFKTRRELWQKLKEAGQLEQVIAELKRRAIDNPNDSQIQTALGVGLMNEFPVQDFNQAALLGMEIDQSFNAALKLDPANWEAQYEKANSMSYWPAVAGDKGPEIIQRLSSLIDQQETMPQQPEFAKTYILLGNQYQKAGQPDQALATWQLGLQKFPNDSTLLKKVSGQ